MTEETFFRKNLTLFEDFIAPKIDGILSEFDSLITHRGFYLATLLFLAVIFMILSFIPNKQIDRFIYKGLRPLNKNISKYFASANTFILISFIIFFITLIISHIAWDQINSNLTVTISIFGGGLAISSYFLSNGIKLHVAMRDNAIELVRSISKSDMREILREVNKYFDEINKKNPPAIGITKSDIDNFKINSDIGKKINITANYFEDIAISIRCHEAQELLLRSYFFHTFINFYENIEKEYIPYARKTGCNDFNQSSANEIFINMEYLYKQWKPVSVYLLINEFFTEINKSCQSICLNKFIDWISQIYKAEPRNIIDIFAKTFMSLMYAVIKFILMLLLLLLIAWFFSCHNAVKKESSHISNNSQIKNKSCIPVFINMPPL